MIVKYGQPLSKIMEHLTELVGPHFYARHDLHLDRQEYAARRAELYGRLEKEPPTEIAGGRVSRSRTDDARIMVLPPARRSPSRLTAPSL